MTKLRSPRSTGPTLFDGVQAAPVSVPVVRARSAEQQQAMKLIADSLRRDIARLESLLSQPLVSWDERDQQVIEVNVALSLAFRAVASLLPADLYALARHFFDLRARLVLREYHEQEG